ncbi:MAG: SH3 domain-containing protein [Hespellia sp.]|nr:SH3 domain-containing protein [Hespellia sp.]
MEKTRKAYIAVLQSWVGKKESNGTHKSIIDIYNTFLPHPRGYAVKYTDSWCATTMSAAAIKLGYTDICPIECSCNELIKKAKAMGIWVENDSYVPNISDWVLYDWDDSGLGDDTGASEHIGAVESVSKSAGTFVVIEGNKSDSVSRRTMQINGRYIRGFITPKYDADTSGTSGGSSSSASTVKVESASKKDSSLAGTYKTTANLNLRAGAGTKKTILVTIPKGTSVKNYGYYTPVGNTKWLYVAVTVAGKQYTGFCSKAYLTK